VRVESNITILDDITLTIEPGTRVEFTGHFGLHVMGTLIADGTEADTIVFTMADADTSGFYIWDDPAGSWWGIIFNNHWYKAGGVWHGADGAMIDNDTSRLDHCIIEFTKSVQDDYFAYGGIESVSFSRLVVSNCEIRNNKCHHRGGGIRAFTNSDIIIRDNYIHHNTAWQWGGGIYLHNSGAIVTGNTIEHNRTLTLNVAEQWAAGGGIGIMGMNPVIRNNTIKYNSAVVGSGIHMYNSFGVIHNNTISYNAGYNDIPSDIFSQGGGIACFKGSSPKISNNFIANNTADEGGGIFDNGSEPGIFGNLIVNNTANITSGALASYSSSEKIVNNTIAHNKADIAGAVEIWNSEPEFMNNIVWNNPDPGGKQIKLLGYFAKLHVQNSIIENGALSFDGESSPTFTGMIEDNPGFDSVSGGIGAGFEGLEGKNWSVADSSPCVNNGSMNAMDLPIPKNDLAGDERIRHTIIDIGAYEVYIPAITAQDTIKTNTTWVADTVRITGDLVINDDVTLTILPGTWVKFLGRYKVQVIGTLKAVGTAADPIFFTVADTSGNWDKAIPDGSWKGIFFDNEQVNNAMEDNDTSVLRYCNIGFVKSLDGEAFEHSAVYVNHFSGLTHDNCTFFENSAIQQPTALFVRLSEIDVTNCKFYNNKGRQGPAIWAEKTDLSIDNCEFRDNSVYDWDGGN
ncbi:MAG: right-handed parallel beta-helix repeat-containing protein, partial [Bacteroidales bacterium]|nr:right-handed parallel beta-helix repeat-containing protein [Bacteroidales bacterium]